MRPPGLMFEAVPDAGGGEVGGGGEEYPTEAVAEPTDTGEAGGEEAAAPGGGEPDYEALFQTPGGQEALREALRAELPQYEDPYAGYEEPQQTGDPLSDFDFLADDAPQQLAAILEQRDQRLLEAIQGSPALVHAEEAANKEWVTNEFSAIEAELKAPLPEPVRAMAISMAAGQRPPDGHPALGRFDPTRALHESAQQLHSLIQEQRAAAVRDYTNGVTGETGVGGSEPSAGGVGAVHSQPVPRNMREAREAWERRQGLAS